MKEYFSTCTTAEQVKNEYRRLCKLWHPDLGPQHEHEERTKMLQEINAAYAQASALYRAEEMRERARRNGDPEPSVEDYANAAAIDERIRQAIERIIALEGLDIEICGLWVWVGGDTKPNKDALKGTGYRWSPNKEKWFFAGVPAGGWSNMNMEQIRFRYGSQRISGRHSKSKDAPAVIEGQ